MKNHSYIIRALEGVSYWRIWIAIFIYSLLFGLLFQFFVLPNIFYKMHAGNGLIIGGDWVGYHEIAKQLAHIIKIDGWQMWELKPYGQSAAGIAAVVYALTISKPFVLLPLYSASMASSALILLRISEELVKSRFAAIISIIPFIFFPSNVAIYDQIGKDAIYFLGAYCCIYSWILTFSMENIKNKYISALIFITIGIFLMWIVRNYSIIVIKNMLHIFILLIIILFIVNFIRNKGVGRQVSGFIILILSLLILHLFPADNSDPRGSLVTVTGVDGTQVTGTGADGTQVAGTGADGTQVTGAGADGTQSGVNYAIPEVKNVGWHGLTFARTEWVKSDYLPSKIDNALLNISILRNGYLADFTNRSNIYKNTGSMVDVDEHLISASEFVKYAPRALQIALLAPFPADWVRNLNSVNGQSGIQVVIAMEMLASYVCLLMLPFAIFRLWRNPFFYITVIFSTLMLLLYAYSTPNIGTLHRLRYGFLAPIITISLGLAVSKFVYKYKVR